VGYTDPNYFSRIFRRYMNVSPSDMVKGKVTNEE
jgi:AraC-like DNA-binding protein